MPVVLVGRYVHPTLRCVPADLKVDGLSDHECRVVLHTLLNLAVKLTGHTELRSVDMSTAVQLHSSIPLNY